MGFNCDKKRIWDISKFHVKFIDNNFNCLDLEVQICEILFISPIFLMFVSIKDFKRAENKANFFYKKNKSIVCPALKWKIKITPNWMEHLRKKDKKHYRSMEDTYIRYKCLLYIKEVLNNMFYYQEYRASIKRVKVRKQRKNSYENKMTEYIWFTAIVKVWLNKNRIKIIVMKVDWTHDYEFLSVIPNWNSKWYSFFENEAIS